GDLFRHHGGRRTGGAAGRPGAYGLYRRRDQGSRAQRGMAEDFPAAHAKARPSPTSLTCAANLAQARWPITTQSTLPGGRPARGMKKTLNILNRIASDVHLMFRRPVREQYGALCYRVKKKSPTVEVLLITSRDTGRWIIPKGWPMDGKTAA